MAIHGLLLLGAALLVPVAAPAQPVAYTIEKIVSTDDPVPGAGASYLWFWDFDLDDEGRVALSAYVAASPLSDDLVATFDGGVGAVVAQSDLPVPGVPGESLGLVRYAVFGGGAVAWAGGWEPWPWAGRGLFVHEAGADTVRVLPGQAAPGGGTFGTIEQSGMNDAKDVVFHSQIEPVNAGPFAVFLSRPGGLEQVVRNGDPVPVPVGGSFSDIEYRIPALADDGSVAFASNVSGGSASSALFRWSPGGTLSTLLRQGDAVSVPGGGTLESFGYLTSMNDAHQIAIIAYVLRPGEASPRAGLYVIDGAEHREVIRQGDELPGTGGEALSTFAGHLAFAINEAGDVAFIGWTATTKGVFVARGTTLYPVAFEGRPAAGMAGEHFREFLDVRINAAGQVGFRAWTTSKEAVFLATPYTPEIPFAPPWALAVLGVAMLLGARRLGRAARR